MSRRRRRSLPNRGARTGLADPGRVAPIRALGARLRRVERSLPNRDGHGWDLCRGRRSPVERAVLELGSSGASRLRSLRCHGGSESQRSLPNRGARPRQLDSIRQRSSRRSAVCGRLRPRSRRSRLRRLGRLGSPAIRRWIRVAAISAEARWSPPGSLPNRARALGSSTRFGRDRHGDRRGAREGRDRGRARALQGCSPSAGSSTPGASVRALRPMALLPLRHSQALVCRAASRRRRADRSRARRRGDRCRENRSRRGTDIELPPRVGTGSFDRVRSASELGLPPPAEALRIREAQAA